MSDAQRLTRSRTVERSDNFSHTENSSSHQNRPEDHASEHAGEKSEPQEPNEQTDSTSRRSASEVRKQLKDLKAQNVLLALQLRVSELERGTRSTSGHRRQHSDDHYRSDARKRANRPREPREQSVTNYDSLMSWLRDCEDFIAAASSDFTTEEEKLRWSASYLSEKPRNQWRDHVTSMRNRCEVPDWKYYTEYLRARLSNPEIRNFQTERRLEAAKQRADQSVADFEQYLTRLYADLDYHIPDETRMMYLRMKVNETIMNESLRIPYTSTNYADLLKHLIGIDLHLRGTGALPKLNSQHSESAASQKSSRPSHGKTKPTEDSKSAASGTQPKGGATVKVSVSKQGAVPFNLTCWSCKEVGHKADNPVCPNYASRQEARNHGEGAGKEKA